MKNKMRIQGKYKPRNPQKYRGDPTNIIIRSSWELTVFKYCDNNKNIQQWSSEEFVVPYRNPFDKRIHRYFPDIWIKYVNNEGVITQSILEIKPKSQSKPPSIPKRKTKSWRYNTHQYIINQAKWEAAEKYCKKRDMKFQVITEDTLKHWSTIPPLNR